MKEESQLQPTSFSYSHLPGLVYVFSIPVCLQNKILSDTLRNISSKLHGSIINNRL